MNPSLLASWLVHQKKITEEFLFELLKNGQANKYSFIFAENNIYQFTNNKSIYNIYIYSKCRNEESMILRLSKHLVLCEEIELVEASYSSRSHWLHFICCFIQRKLTTKQGAEQNKLKGMVEFKLATINAFLRDQV